MRFVILALLALGVVMAPAQVRAKSFAEYMAERYVEAVNTGDVDLLDAIVAEDVVSKGEEPGLDALKSRIADNHSPESPFANLRYELVKAIGDGHEVAVYLTLTVTVKANGQEVTTDVMSFWHLNEGGYISEIVAVMDIEPIFDAMSS